MNTNLHTLFKGALSLTLGKSLGRGFRRVQVQYLDGTRPAVIFTQNNLSYRAVRFCTGRPRFVPVMF